MSNKPTDVITLMVDSEFGVLTRVTALIRREGLNIRSLAVSETDSTDVSRLTVSLYRRHSSLEQVVERLRRQTSVREVTVFSQDNQIAQELCIVRLAADDPVAIENLCKEHNMNRIGKAEDGDEMLSFCCEPGQTDQVLEQCRKIGLKDIARTGTIALMKGNGKGDGEQ